MTARGSAACLLGLLAVAAVAGPALSQDRAAAPDTAHFAGTWQGTLTVGPADLRVVFHLERRADGGLTGTMDSPDQGATDIPLDRVLVETDTLRLRVPSIAGTYAGILRDSARTLEGTWRQGGTALPLTLVRTADVPTVRRPQTPELPYPYRTETISFRNPAAGLTLEGTLTRPDTSAPVPGVVLVGGTGPQDRNGTVMGHRPFHVLADALTRRDLAVLRFDERGVGRSGGTQQGATSADLATDVAAAVDALARQPRVDADRIGLIGHGEGGRVAAITAARADRVAFLVLLAAPGLPGRDLLAAQLDRHARRHRADRRTRALQRGTQRRLFQTLTQEADSATIARQLRRIMREAKGIRGERTIAREVKRLMDPWFRFYLTHDPRATLREVDVPVLALAAGRDRQMDPDTNQTAIRTALRAGGNTRVTTRTLDSLNHYFQFVPPGQDPQAYGRIRQTFSPAAIDRIATWIGEHVGRTAP